MTGSFVVRLPYTAPPLRPNEQRRGHWSATSREKRAVAEAVVAAVKGARIPVLTRAGIILTWYAPDRGVRDADGLSVMLKAVVDALTPSRAAVAAGTPTKAGTPRKTALPARLGAGIIPDDRSDVVPFVGQEIVQPDPDPRIELTIIPLTPAQVLRVVPVRAGDAAPAEVAPVVRAQRSPVQPPDGGAAWRARVEQARGRR